MARRGVNLRRVAVLQRWLVWVFLGLMSAFAGLMVTSGGSMPETELMLTIIHGVLYFGAIGLAATLAAANGRSVLHIVGLVVLMFFPLVNLIALAAESEKASRILSDAGFDVGLAGVNPEQLHRLTEGVCTGCGYSQSGLDGPRCPECGLEKSLAVG